MNKKFLDLGYQPLANEYLKNFRSNQIKYKLKIYFDTLSKMVSISKRKCLILNIHIDLQCLEQ